VAAALRAAAMPFGVNSLAQVAALASLDAEGELAVRVKALVAERERVVAGLCAQGWQLADQQANFVWLGLSSRTAEFAAACDAAGITVRAYGSDGARATIAEPEANDRLLEVAGEFRTRMTPRT
ncbi:MAG: aminotransferase class I/II-fold pyridoxal phosphate-dependent enzyme, partial [Phycicoccus sp.]